MPVVKVFLGYQTQKQTPAHPRPNIVPCPYCHHPKCNRHGHYFRKATHRFFEIIRIQRYRCRPCKATHSLLPHNLLPICRWWLGDILRIAARLTQGESAYSIARSLCESLAGVLYLKVWLKEAGSVVLALTREEGLFEMTPPRPAPTDCMEALALTGLWPSWPAFTRAFSRAFYPKRFPLWSTHTILTG